jgi:hypothetical protein
MSVWEEYNNNVKAATPDWFSNYGAAENVGNVAKGAGKGFLSGIPFGPIGAAAGTILGAVGSGLNAIWQNKQARRQNQLMAEAFEYQKEQDALSRRERERERNINVIAMMQKDIREAMYGHVTGRW